MKRPVVFVIALWVLGATTVAAPVDLWFEKANDHYEEKHYDSAAAYYHRIIDAGVNNSAVYYNLGNTYFRRHDIGKAVLYYEKAREIAPTDPDILTNIRFANLNIVDRVPEPQRGFFAALIVQLHTRFPLGSQMWTLLGLLLALSIFFSLSLFVSRNVRLWLIYLSCLIVLVSAALGISVGVKIYRRENIPYAIVLAESVGAMNEPKGGKVLFTAHEGTKLRVRKTMDNWSLVSLPNGVSGWVRQKDLGRI